MKGKGMKIYGLQKMTLLDFPGRIACTVFLGGCDMRCPFCHNSELAAGTAEPVMEEETLLTFLKKRQGMLDGVAVTGGEPLLGEAALELLRKIRALGYPVKLDTNGTHPDRLRRAVEEGLVQYCAMDVKNSPERYGETAGVPGMDLGPVRESVAFLLEGRTDYEFRTTVVREFHDADSFRAIGSWVHGAKRFALQKFADRDTVPFGNLHAAPREKMQEYLEIARRTVPDTRLRGVD